MSTSGAARAPRLNLNTPVAFEPTAFADALKRALDGGDVACLRVRLKDATEDELKRALAALVPVAHARDVAVVVSDAYRLALPFGADGVHFERGRAPLKEARAALGPDAIIGVDCGPSRHAGLRMAEQGADYVAFAPVAPSASAADTNIARPGLFAWWQLMIETPVIAEGGMTLEQARDLSPLVDFIGASRSIWTHDAGPAAAVGAYHAAIRQGLEAPPPDLKALAGAEAEATALQFGGGDAADQGDAD